MIPPGLGHGLIVWLLRNSASAAVVALLVLLAQWLLGRRISARWCHNLWLLVIVRLLVPPLPAVKVAAPPHLALLRPLIRHVQQVTVRTDATQPRVTKHEVAPAAVLTVRTAPEFPPTDVESGKTEINIDDAAPIEAHLVRVERPWAHDFREEQPATDKSESRATPASATPIVHPLRTSRARLAQSGAQPAERSRPIPWFSIVAVMWGIVALALLLKTFLGSVRIGIAARGLRPVRDPALVELLNDCCRLLNIQSPPTLLEGPPQSGPALVGLMYPRLLLPPCVVDQFAWRELRHVILHELVHLKRRDILVNYIVSLLQAVHWFNPLVWLAAGRIRSERELACDEAVLSVSPWREGRAYGSTIVKLLELLSHGAVPAGAMGVIGHKALMHRRIAMIARFDGSRRHWSASAILLSAAVAGTALAGAVRAQVQPAEQPQAAGAAEVPATDVKPDASSDEAGAKQAVQAEADRSEPTPPATDAPPPTVKDGLWVTTETQPPAAADAAPPPGGVPTAAPVPGDVIQPTPGAAPFGGPQPGTFRSRNGFAGRPQMGAGGPMIPNQPRMAGMGGFGGQGAISQPQTATIEDAAAVKADAKTVEKLQGSMPLQVEGQSFEDVLNMLAQKGGFDVLIDNRALGELNLIPQVQMNIREPQPIEQLLHFVLRQVGGDDIGFSVVHGVVVVSSKAALDRHVVTRVYDIRELGSQEDIQQTIDQTIGTNIAVRFVNGKMIATTSEPNQREVSKLLAMLRQDGPQANAIGAAPPPGQQRTVTGEELRVYQLRHADAQDTAKTIQSKLARPGLSISSDARTNSLIITGPKGQVQEAGALIRSIDGGGDANDPRANPTEPPAVGR